MIGRLWSDALDDMFAGSLALWETSAKVPNVMTEVLPEEPFLDHR